MNYSDELIGTVLVLSVLLGLFLWFSRAQKLKLARELRYKREDELRQRIVEIVSIFAPSFLEVFAPSASVSSPAGDDDDGPTNSTFRRVSAASPIETIEPGCSVRVRVCPEATFRPDVVFYWASDEKALLVSSLKVGTSEQFISHGEAPLISLTEMSFFPVMAMGMVADMTVRNTSSEPVEFGFTMAGTIVDN